MEKDQDSIVRGDIGQGNLGRVLVKPEIAPVRIAANDGEIRLGQDISRSKGGAVP